MTSRRESLARLLRLQAQLQRLNEAAGAALSKQHQAIVEKDSGEREMLAGAAGFGSEFKRLLAGQIRRNAARAGIVDARRSRVEAVGRQWAARARLSERLLDKVEDEDRRTAERRDLDALTELAAAARATRFR